MKTALCVIVAVGLLIVTSTAHADRGRCGSWGVTITVGPSYGYGGYINYGYGGYRPYGYGYRSYGYDSYRSYGYGGYRSYGHRNFHGGRPYGPQPRRGDWLYYN